MKKIKQERILNISIIWISDHMEIEGNEIMDINDFNKLNDLININDLNKWKMKKICKISSLSKKIL